MKLKFEKLAIEDAQAIVEMSKMATSIVREHFDPLIGKEQNDYMLARFQTVDAIKSQLKQGYQYYFVKDNGCRIGFLAYYPKADVMYLSKFYLYKDKRGNGYSKEMLRFVIEKTKEYKLSGIELNVNKYNSACKAYDRLGFQVIRSEKNDIGNGFFMDDYVYYLEIG